MSNSSENNPPKGDFQTAEKYINQLVSLLNENKIEVFNTDLKKFDPTSLQDHYTINLRDYQIEISHSKQADSGKDSYVMIFNNRKQIAEGSPAKVILAYIYLADSQFSKFKIVAAQRIEQRRKAEEEKRFKEALRPVDDLLEQASSGQLHSSADIDQSSEEKLADNFSDSPQIHQV